MNNERKEKKNKISMQKNLKIETDQITINGDTYKLGEWYNVVSPLNSPYLFMEDDIKTRRNLIGKDCRKYVGKLTQIPRVEENTDEVFGSCLYLEVNDINYHRDYRQTEQLTLIMAGVTKITPLS